MRQALEVDALPRPPSTRRAVRTAAGLGLATGLLSTLPSPLPDIRLGDPAILINATGVPLHAGLVFAALVAVLIWSWQARDPGKCFLAAGLTVIGWLTAVNTADEVISEIAASDLFGTAQGAKESREILGWLAAGLSGGLIGAGFTACGVSLGRPLLQKRAALDPCLGRGRAVRTFTLSCRCVGRGLGAVRPLAGCRRGFDRVWSLPDLTRILSRNAHRPEMNL